jgi:hypothetical protein
MKNILVIHRLLIFLLLFSIKNASISQSLQHKQLNAAEYDGKLDQLLSLEIAAEITGFDPKKAQKIHENNTHKAFGGEAKPPRECRYYWSNGRTKALKIGDNVLEGPYEDFVEITRISNTTIERFKRNYPSLTPAQRQAAQEELGKASQNNSERNEASDALDKTASDMISKHEAEQIQHVGDAAVWFPQSNELRVFFNGLTFSVRVDISDDNLTNKAKAIELTNIIIEEKLN